VELIVVDDASTDNSIQVLEGFKNNSKGKLDFRIIKKIIKPEPENQCTVPNNSLNGLYISNTSSNPNETNLPGAFFIDVSSQSTFDPSEFDSLAYSNLDNKGLQDALTQVFQEYPWPNSSDLLTTSSSTMDFNFSTDEILLEGYGPWNDDFEKAMSLIDQGNQVILKKEDPSGIERPVTIKLKQGENNKELVVDLTNLGIIECSDILPKLLNYLLNQDGKSIILNCGLVGPDDLIEEVEEYILSDLPCGTAYELIYREIPKGYMHPVLIFK
jgi:glycosyltransferase involved in cell wall biosynthesis